VSPAAAGLALLMAMAAGFDLLLDDDRMLAHTRLLWPMTSTLLIASDASNYQDPG
jgi:hypothetical protein